MIFSLYYVIFCFNYLNFLLDKLNTHDKHIWRLTENMDVGVIDANRI